MTPLDMASTLAPLAMELVDVMPGTEVERVVLTADVIDGEPYWDVCVRSRDGWVTVLHAFEGGCDEDS